jgi:Cu/Ag efflux pump CusA
VVQLKPRSKAMRRIAASMVGGMVRVMQLTLVVIPAMFPLWQNRRLRRAAGSWA